MANSCLFQSSLARRRIRNLMVKMKKENLKTKSVEVDNIINTTNPIWTKAPADLSDEDYLDFYKQLYPFSEDPLFWIHLNVDYPFNLNRSIVFP